MQINNIKYNNNNSRKTKDINDFNNTIYSKKT